ncbi:MAG TPA: hypothetical protein VJS66_04725 [Burkholderiales bacterium]|nr:hypothetical protein [Burkholderiales bacterium]
MNPQLREKLLPQLRVPSRKADMLIERYLGNPNDEDGCLPYTSSVEAAMTLLPEGVHFLCGRFEGGKLFWCDVGFRPQVQAWGETLAAAIAGAVFAYHTLPGVSEVRQHESTVDTL